MVQQHSQASNWEQLIAPTIMKIVESAAQLVLALDLLTRQILDQNYIAEIEFETMDHWLLMEKELWDF